MTYLELFSPTFRAWAYALLVVASYFALQIFIAAYSGRSPFSSVLAWTVASAGVSGFLVYQHRATLPHLVTLTASSVLYLALIVFAYEWNHGFETSTFKVVVSIVALMMTGLIGASSSYFLTHLFRSRYGQT